VAVVRDYQRGRVYAWERVAVAPHGESVVAFAAAQGMVDAIWAESGLRYPPKVEHLPRQSRRVLASATRLVLCLPRAVPCWCLLHELAHAMAATHDGYSDQHGPRFMGLYLRLLVRYLRLPEATLLASARTAGIDVDPDAVPPFLDPSAQRTWNAPHFDAASRGTAGQVNR
jgi:hypothetical protein